MKAGGNSKGGPSYPWAKSTDFLRPVTPRHPWPQVGLLRSRPDLFPRLFNSRFLPASVHDTRHVGRDIYVRLWEPIGRAAPWLSDRHLRFAEEGTQTPLLSRPVRLGYFEPTVVIHRLLLRILTDNSSYYLSFKDPFSILF